jgi:stearoyl-CoA desaturase (delta-9 desaturase)
MKEILKNILTIKHLWGGIVPLWILGLYALFTISSAPAWWPVAFVLGYILVKMVGIGAGWHRLFSHRSFEVNRPAKLFILFCGVIGAQGSPIMWAGAHGAHHRYSDTDKDPHTPNHGFWHSYCLWMFKMKEGDINVRHVLHWVRDPDVAFVHKHYSSLLWAINIIFALVSVDLWLYFIILPAFITLQVFSIQTSLVHMKGLGYRNFETKDNSRNCPILFPLTQGECWHNNHHGEPWNPNFGGRKRWEIDPTFWMIKLLRR